MRAIVMAHTPSGATPCCDEHANKLHSLMSSMGAHCNITLILEDEPVECVNCINEAKKAEKK